MKKKKDHKEQIMSKKNFAEALVKLGFINKDHLKEIVDYAENSDISILKSMFLLGISDEENIFAIRKYINIFMKSEDKNICPKCKSDMIEYKIGFDIGGRRKSEKRYHLIGSEECLKRQLSLQRQEIDRLKSIISLTSNVKFPDEKRYHIINSQECLKFQVSLLKQEISRLKDIILLTSNVKFPDDEKDGIKVTISDELHKPRASQPSMSETSYVSGAEATWNALSKEHDYKQKLDDIHKAQQIARAEGYEPKGYILESNEEVSFQIFYSEMDAKDEASDIAGSFDIEPPAVIPLVVDQFYAVEVVELRKRIKELEEKLNV